MTNVIGIQTPDPLEQIRLMRSASACTQPQQRQTVARQEQPDFSSKPRARRYLIGPPGWSPD